MNRISYTLFGVATVLLVMGFFAPSHVRPWIGVGLILAALISKIVQSRRNRN
jgi:hypothetical protein